MWLQRYQLAPSRRRQPPPHRSDVARPGSLVGPTTSHGTRSTSDQDLLPHQIKTRRARVAPLAALADDAVLGCHGLAVLSAHDLSFCSITSSRPTNLFSSSSCPANLFPDGSCGHFVFERAGEAAATPAEEAVDFRRATG